MEEYLNTNAYGGLGLFADDDYMYYASISYAGRRGVGGYTDSWQAFNVSNNGNLCPITKFSKFICFLNGRYLAVWDIGASAWNNNRLNPTIPSGYWGKWLVPLKDWLVISAHHSLLGSALFLWDGVSQGYNSVIQLPGRKSLAAVSDGNNLFIITEDGWINRFTGSGLDPVVQFPDMDNTDTILVEPGAVQFYKGLIYIGKKADGDNLKKRYQAGGMWVFNPKTEALYLKHTLSNFATTSTNGVSSVSSVFPDQGNTSLRVCWNDGTKTKIDRSSNAGTPRPHSYGAILVTPLFDNTPALRKRFSQIILNYWKQLPNNSNARFVLKYNISESYQKGTISPLSGTSSTFTLDQIQSYMEIGDEITVLSGNGASQIRHITAINTDTKVVTVDEPLSDSASYDSTSMLQVSAFKKIGTIKGSDYPGSVNRLLRFNARAKKIQFKIEIWSPSGQIGEWDMGIADITTVYIPDRSIR
jgi:hypothetical protein